MNRNNDLKNKIVDIKGTIVIQIWIDITGGEISNWKTHLSNYPEERSKYKDTKYLLSIKKYGK